jgi:mono/diheme cytochrome c family protein
MVRDMTLRLPALALVAAALAGCGGSSAARSKPSTAQTGAQIFATAGCSGCHTLAAAKATGQVGPNLDHLKPSAATVRHQVTHGGGGMPSFKNTLSAKQIGAVATYVARVAGTG